MKCPKCGYVGFDEGDRCRNCGYEFSLADLTSDEIPGRSKAAAPEIDADEVALLRPPPRPLDLDRIIGAPEPEPSRRGSSELPLFTDNARDAGDAPLVSPAAPRVPLSVRREAAPSPRLRPRAAQPSRELDLDSDDSPPSWEPSWHAESSLSHQMAEPASPGPRLAAAAIDALLIFAIDAAVVYFTLKLCRLTPFDITMLPALPMLGFFVLLNGGYLAAFTAAGGQTVGKMTTGIRVVAEADQAVDFGRAVVRTLASLVSVLPVGLGFIPAFFDEDRRALHDRLTGTRVVKAV